MKKFILLIALFSIAISDTFSQRVKDETIEYSFIQLPANPLNPEILNYQVSVFTPYEADNQKKIAEYEKEKQLAQKEYDDAMAAYPGQVKAAKEEYEAEMAAWKEKSLAEKVVEKQLLNENNKPVERIPREPYLRHVNEPVLKTTYDNNLLASTYFNLGGFNNLPENAVKIEVTMYGFDFTQPRQLTVQKNVTRVSNGNTSTVPVTYYYTEFSYRHPMSVKVINADGTELMNLTPQDLNTYTVYKSPETEQGGSFNQELLIKTHEEKVLQENFKYINDLVNDEYGYPALPRTTELYYVKDKGDTYNDLTTAFNEASSAFKLLANDEKAAFPKIEGAVSAWSVALQEADVNDKKARVNEKVAMAVAFNLLEGHFALRNWQEGEKVISFLNTMNLSNKEKEQKAVYEEMFADLKRRVLINQ